MLLTQAQADAAYQGAMALWNAGATGDVAIAFSVNHGERDVALHCITFERGGRVVIQGQAKQRETFEDADVFIAQYGMVA